MFKLDLEKAEDPEIKWSTSIDHWIIEKAREFQKKTSTYASLTTLKALTV